jgi:hypothetical protein
VGALWVAGAIAVAQALALRFATFTEGTERPLTTVLIGQACDTLTDGRVAERRESGAIHPVASIADPLVGHA